VLSELFHEVAIDGVATELSSFARRDCSSDPNEAPRTGCTRKTSTIFFRLRPGRILARVRGLSTKTVRVNVVAATSENV
jgi:hypothetical protein